MHPFELIEQLPWLGPVVAVAIGVVMGASPLAWPALLTATGLRTGGSTTGRGRGEAGARGSVVALGAGLTLVYAVVGASGSQLEAVLRDGLGAWAGITNAVLGLLAAAAGVALLRRPAASCRVVVRRERGGLGALLAGIPLGVVTCPACAGIITGVAVSAAVVGSTAYAVAVMVALGVGHTLTLLAVGELSARTAGDLVRPVAVQRLGGGLLVLAGVAFVVQAVLGGVEVAPALP